MYRILYFFFIASFTCSASDCVKTNDMMWRCESDITSAQKRLNDDAFAHELLSIVTCWAPEDLALTCIDILSPKVTDSPITEHLMVPEGVCHTSDIVQLWTKYPGAHLQPRHDDVRHAALKRGLFLSQYARENGAPIDSSALIHHTFSERTSATGTCGKSQAFLALFYPSMRNVAAQDLAITVALLSDHGVSAHTKFINGLSAIDYACHILSSQLCHTHPSEFQQHAMNIIRALRRSGAVFTERQRAYLDSSTAKDSSVVSPGI